MGAYFQNVFELNTTKTKLLGFTILHLEAEIPRIWRPIRAIETTQTRSLAKQIGIFSFHVYLDDLNDCRVSCTFYPSICFKMGAYFNDIFELNTAEHNLLRFPIPHLVANSTGSNRIAGLNTCILCDERNMGKGNKLNIPWP